jgi:uncharacterized damage-inducible protein DinB
LRDHRIEDGENLAHSSQESHLVKFATFQQLRVLHLDQWVVLTATSKEKMEVDKIFQANRAATERMRKIINRLSDEELSKSIGSDWTISITLAHLALWDQRVIFVIESAKKNDKLHAPYYDYQLNDILTPLLRVIPAQEAARMAITTAETLDKELEQCSTQVIEEMNEVNPRLIDRSIHRNLHLDEIENAVVESPN